MTKLNDLFHRRSRENKQQSSGLGSNNHARKSSLTLSAFNFHFTIEKEDKKPLESSSRPVSAVEPHNSHSWWPERKSLVEDTTQEAEAEAEEMDQLLKSRKMGSVAARRRKALEREAAASIEDLKERRARDLSSGYKSSEEEVSEEEDNTYSPVICDDESESQSLMSVDTASLHQARYSTCIRASLSPPLPVRNAARVQSGLTLQTDQNRLSTTSANLQSAPSPIIFEMSDSDASEAEDYFSLTQDSSRESFNFDDLDANTPIEVATPILYVSPVMRPSMVTIPSRTPPQLKRLNIPSGGSPRPGSSLRSAETVSSMALSPSPETAINSKPTHETLPSLSQGHPTSASASLLDGNRPASPNPFHGSSLPTSSAPISVPNHTPSITSPSSTDLAQQSPSLHSHHSTSSLHQQSQSDSEPSTAEDISVTESSNCSLSSTTASLARTPTLTSLSSLSTTHSTASALFPSASQPAHPNLSSTTLPTSTKERHSHAHKKSFQSLRSISSKSSRGRFPIKVSLNTQVAPFIPHSTATAVASISPATTATAITTTNHPPRSASLPQSPGSTTSVADTPVSAYGRHSIVYEEITTPSTTTRLVRDGNGLLQSPKRRSGGGLRRIVGTVGRKVS
ncbi:MAG: hypothetical protein Q9227_007584 [Pyrenula ochraceoflavens]